MRLTKHRLCPCGCGRVVKGRRKYASNSCAKVNHPSTSRSKVKCKCGCGHYLSVRQVKTGIKFVNHSHANMYNAGRLKGKKYKKYNMMKNKGFSKIIDGKQYCKNYNSNELNCVMCMEQALFKAKSCYEEGK